MTTNIPASNSAASLISNVNTVSSTMPLNPGQVPQKDYAAAFGNLQSRYGAVPTHLPPPTQKKAEESSRISSGKNTSSGTLGATEGASASSGGGAATHSSGTPSPTTAEGAQKKAEGAKKKRFLLPWKGSFIFIGTNTAHL
ncbi:hypothetical protein BT96DRAFT_1027462 [Gymnopus androsaceus JB14]|uniref:Uncharacterized protein n=1 Tax=Gymnopus androsaceus JB14 TaxID=1447944 RepID=A0A6A4GBU3_9AGAR|nr:hypothetical protein BT96DRAFT_1027462 [Gymnopus androsaceus JB14]